MTKILFVCHAHRQRCRLMTMDLDRENGKLVNVRSYTLPKISGTKYTNYNHFVWKDGAGLQLLCSGPLDWDMKASILGVATIQDPGDAAPELELHTFQSPDWYYPNCTLVQNDGLFYEFSQWGRLCFFQ